MDRLWAGQRIARALAVRLDYFLFYMALAMFRRSTCAISGTMLAPAWRQRRLPGSKRQSQKLLLSHCSSICRITSPLYSSIFFSAHRIFKLLLIKKTSTLLAASLWTLAISALSLFLCLLSASLPFFSCTACHTCFTHSYAAFRMLHSLAITYPGGYGLHSVLAGKGDNSRVTREQAAHIALRALLDNVLSYER